jgi:DNA-binding transcriptional LysR family regulator
MQFETLKIFCDVARHRSFSQAALEHGVTQSAVSHVVAQLEERVGGKLIDRSTRPLRLTALGLSYYEGCKGLWDEYKILSERYLRLEASLRGGGIQVAGTAEVAAIYSVGLGDMGQYVETFCARHPQAHVHVEYLHPDRVYERVQEGAADLGLVSFPRKTGRLTAERWRAEEMVLACSPRHALAHNLAVRPAELAGEKYVHFTRELVIRREVDRFLREQGVTVDVTAEFDNIENIKKAVEVGAGVALLPEPTVRREVAGRSLVARPLFGCRLVRPLGIIHRRQGRLSPTARAFLELLRGQEGNGRPTGDAHFNGAAAADPDGVRKSRRSCNGAPKSATKYPAN